jgi:hypothetical protein
MVSGRPATPKGSEVALDQETAGWKENTKIVGTN